MHLAFTQASNFLGINLILVYDILERRSSESSSYEKYVQAVHGVGGHGGCALAHAGGS